MIKLSACIEMLLKEEDDFYSRFEAANKAGLGAVEFWDYKNKDIEKLKTAKETSGMKIAAFCVSSDDSEFNSKKLVYRETLPAFLDACRDTVATAKYLDTQTVILTVGNERNDITRYEQHTNIVLALKQAAPIFEESGVTCVVEPLNVLKNHMGYYLSSTYEAFGILEEVGSPSIKLLYDVYHQQITDGNIIENIRKYNRLIGHYHIADVPGRHEPGTGELNYAKIFSEIDATGYDKYVGMEFHPIAPSDTTIAGTISLTR